jgi:UDP-glucose 4-epimerase
MILLGGDGYIGKYIASWMKDSHSIQIVDNALGLFTQDMIDAENDLEGETVIHCAGLIQVRESLQDPLRYWENNVAKTILYFQRNRKGRPKQVIFSSTASVYAQEGGWLGFSEQHPIEPTNPYGQTKQVLEMFLAHVTDCLTIFRFFNVAGGRENHKPETHLIPTLIRCALTHEPFFLNGDGSAVRDFVHPNDIARAHELALGKPGIFNLGSGEGHSVLEVIQMVEEETGFKIQVEKKPEIVGEPKRLVANISKARKELGWEPMNSLRAIIRSAIDSQEESL